MLYKCETILYVDVSFEVEARNSLEAVRNAEVMLRKGRANLQVPDTAMGHSTLKVTPKIILDKKSSEAG